MYYLTRIELDPYKKLTQLALKNANMIHGTIEKVFGNEAERKLWRIDSLRGRRYLMIVSQTLPDFTITHAVRAGRRQEPVKIL